MVRRTRTLVVSAALVAAMALPLEYLAVKGLTRRRSISDAWVDRMTPGERKAAGDRIEEIPKEYRRALVGKMTPAERATIWHRRVEAYTVGHPELTVDQHRLLDVVLQFGTPNNLTDDHTATPQMRQLALRVKNEIGNDAYTKLFYFGGASHSVSDSPLPLRVKLETLLLTSFVAEAFVDCNCYSVDNGDCGGGLPVCSELTDCERSSYFGCGIWYLEPCTGYCS